MHKSRLCYITIDCSDLERAISFWSAALKAEPEPFDDMEQQIYRRLKLPNENIRILLQAVPEKKSSKSRIHVDIESDDIDAEASRLEQLGAKKVRCVEELGYRFWVMNDLFENEFCVVQPEYPGLLKSLGQVYG